MSGSSSKWIAEKIEWYEVPRKLEEIQQTSHNKVIGVFEGDNGAFLIIWKEG